MSPARRTTSSTPRTCLRTDFDELSTAEKHQVAAAELTDGTVPFTDDLAAIEYGRDYWNDYVDNLDPSAKQALWDYTGETFPSYHDMNGHLRGTPGYGPRPEVLHDIGEMDRVMSTRPVPDDIMVVRGTGLGHLNLESPLDMLGNTYPDKGYISTSLGNHPVPSFAGKEAILHLRVPKGTPALWLEKVSKFGRGRTGAAPGPWLRVQGDPCLHGQWPGPGLRGSPTCEVREDCTYEQGTAT